MISQCPNCKTRFVVSDAKLDIAGGSVRCGACMQVFSATNHQTTDHRNTAANTLTDIPEEHSRIAPSMESMVGFETMTPIEAPPIEINLNAKPPFKNRLFGIIGVSLCLAFLCIIALHWLLAHPQQFKNHPRWQDAYQLACNISKPIISCDLEENGNAYQTQSLKMISHPTQENTLLLEIVILNKTKRPLPFPIINVQLSNIKEELLDDLHFTAEEYLRGELKTAEHLPPATPVHINLSITDPGPAAVNYNIELR